MFVLIDVLFVSRFSVYGVHCLFVTDGFAMLLLQTRDVKLLPKSVRGVLVIRRTCRKKIHERVMAVSGTDCLVLVDYGTLNVVS
jgi:chromatin assembly factor 1 subunit A